MNKLNRELLISYAQTFVSFFLRNINLKETNIRTIYLFGSVARGDFKKDSDVDIFIDSDDKKLSVVKDRILSKFYKSSDYKKFELMGVDNEIKVIVGELDEWELKESVQKNGIVFFGCPAQSIRRYFLVVFEPIKEVRRRNKVIRKLFGRKEKHYVAKGLISELKGEQISERIFIVPAEEIRKILSVFSKEKVNYKLEEIWK